ncbi:MAG: hypothetical protein AAF362_00335 [Pseudomonadota bacterium]
MIFVLCCGFTLSGIAASILEFFTGSDPRFQVTRRGPIAMLCALIIFMIAGPYMLVSATLRRWSAGTLPVLALLIAGGLAAIWSFCSGVLVFQALLITGIVNV